MDTLNEVQAFIEQWKEDPLNVRQAFIKWRDYFLSVPKLRLEFNARPGISYSLRAVPASQAEPSPLVLVDVVDDEPSSRWLSVCFYADMVSDPEEIGDFVPSGLLGKDALCFNYDTDDPGLRDYIAARLKEAVRASGL